MTPGRPRAFDVDEALLEAMRVFWAKGYEGASLSDLTEAMGINRPSLYAAFGNKEQLYRMALARYGTRGPEDVSLAEPTARAVIMAWLRTSVYNVTNPGMPRGCFLTHATMTCGDAPPDVRDEIVGQHRRNTETLRRRLERAAAEGDLPPDIDPTDLARYVQAVAQGVAVHAAAGATRDELLDIVDVAMRVVPV